MAYMFRFGKASVKDAQPYLETPDNDPNVWADEFEMSPNIGSPVREPGYNQWRNTLEHLPAFQDFWTELREMASEYSEWIPCSAYVDKLVPVEKEAKSLVFKKDGDAGWAAYRSSWFCAWTRECIRLYGDQAVFEKPGEWE